MVNNNLAIKLEQVGLRFHFRQNRPTTLKEAAMHKIRRVQSEEHVFWALRDVSFEVQHGERLGLIGPNGSGKTTLLSLAAGVYRPDEGTVTTRGRTVGLLGLGVGFDPEMTGLENISFNAALYGLSSKEIARHFDDIVAFADIGEFISQPVKTYSSGMVARLGFAVAAHIDADIILLDEVIAVGDSSFQHKCKARMQRLCDENKTLLLVSHSMEAIRSMCHRAIWLEHGHIVAAGPMEEVVKAYKEKYADD